MFNNLTYIIFTFSNFTFPRALKSNCLGFCKHIFESYLGNF